MDNNQVGPDDQLFAEAALSLGAVSSEQLSYAEQVQSAWRAEGTALPLSHVLQHLGYIHSAAIAHIQQEAQQRQASTQPPEAPSEDSNPMDAWGNLSGEFDMAPPPPDPNPMENWSSLETSGEVEAHIFQTWAPAAEVEPQLQPLLAPATPVTPVQNTAPQAAPRTSSERAHQINSGFSKAIEPKKSLEEKLIGSTLGSFKILEKIGQGGRGIVFKAVQETMGREVAIKVLTEAVAADPVNLARFRQEALAAGKITDRFIVGAIDYGESDGMHYMVMPYIKGQTCEDRIKSSKKSGLGFAVKLTQQMAKALVAIEDEGLIHRDIKPGNIIIREDGDACLMDLGLAKSIAVDQTLTAIGNTVGTPDYMSPEQCLGRPLSIKTDVYALGATIFHVLTGRSPFQADSPLQMMKLQVKAPVPNAKDIRSDTPSPIAKLLQHMLAKDPGKRPEPSFIVEYCQQILDRAVAQASGQPVAPATAPTKKQSSRSSMTRGKRKASKSLPKAPPKDPDGLNSSCERRVSRPRRRRRGRSDNTLVIAVGLLFVVVAGVAAVFLLTQQPG
ncbi:MAG: serine/threonine-protein kinase [Planctomycetota bacterium]|nr:serine/threonine-protein kinase [Planctomycetota bacterium]